MGKKQSGFKTSKAPSEPKKPAPKMSKDTNKEVFNAFQKALKRK